MPGIIIDLADEKILRSYDMISKKIINYIYDMGLLQEVDTARKIYFGKHIKKINTNKIGTGYKPFIQWLIFSYKIYNGHSLIDCIYENYIDTISSYEKDALASLRNTYEGLYEIYLVEGEKILLKDTFSGDEKLLLDNTLAENVKRYFGIFARFTVINNKLIAIPGYSVMTNSFLKNAEKYIMHTYKEYNKHEKYSSIQNFINRNSLMIHRYFLDYQI